MATYISAGAATATFAGAVRDSFAGILKNILRFAELICAQSCWSVARIGMSDWDCANAKNIDADGEWVPSTTSQTVI